MSEAEKEVNIMEDYLDTVCDLMDMIFDELDGQLDD